LATVKRLKADVSSINPSSERSPLSLVICVSLLHQCSTTVSLETNPLVRMVKMGLFGVAKHED